MIKYHQFGKMAKQLDVSRTTVESAYLQLLVEGYIYAKKK